MGDLRPIYYRFYCLIEVGARSYKLHTLEKQLSGDYDD